MRIIITLILIAGATAAGGYFWTEHVKAIAAAEAPKVATAKVESGPIRQTVQATGTMASNLDVDIKCKSSGEIIKLPFDISNEVKKGELLLEIDPIDEQRAKDEAEAALASSTSKLESAKQNLIVADMQLTTDRGHALAAVKSAQAANERLKVKVERMRIGLNANAVTKEDYDQAVADQVAAEANVDLANVMTADLKREEQALELRRQDIKLAEAQVKSDQVSLEIAQQHLDECKVFAPMDGVVSARGVQIGQIIASAISNVGGGSTVLTLSDLSRVFSMASVDESDIGNVKVGQTVNVTADAYPGRRFHGKVTRIATTGVNVSNVVTFQVQIEILDPKKTLLKPQMTTNVEIVAAEKDTALIVPNDTITHKKAKKFVTVQKPDGTTEDKEVQTGINDGDRSEIVSGVDEGMVLLVKKSGGNDRWSGGNRPQQPAPGFGAPPMGGGRPR